MYNTNKRPHILHISYDFFKLNASGNYKIIESYELHYIKIPKTNRISDNNKMYIHRAKFTFIMETNASTHRVHMMLIHIAVMPHTPQ